jgi:hypothetical protein
MRFEKSFKSHSNKEWLYCWKQTWFDKVDTLFAIMSKLEHCWRMNKNYTKKLVTSELSHTIYDFPNI